MKVTAAIQATGYGLSGDIGGLPRTTYYTPDGRVIKTIPAIREYAIRDKDGKVISTGTRDANLDKGWLLAPPSMRDLKLFCKGCDKWHDTPQEIKACIAQGDKLIKKLTRKTQKEETDKTIVLEGRVAELEALVAKLSKEGNGQVLQSTHSQSGTAQNARQKRNGSQKKAVQRGAT